MIKIEMLPLQGIVIESIGKINLGDTKTIVKKILGKPSSTSSDEKFFYHKYELKICFDKSNHVEFIECNGLFSTKTELSMYGIHPFKIEGDELIKILTKKNNGKVDDSEADYSYTFLNISVGIWRDSSPKEFKKEINEAKRNGEYEKDKKYFEEELERAKYFWTIAIGKKGYYS